METPFTQSRWTWPIKQLDTHETWNRKQKGEMSMTHILPFLGKIILAFFSAIFFFIHIWLKTHAEGKGDVEEAMFVLLTAILFALWALL